MRFKRQTEASWVAAIVLLSGLATTAIYANHQLSHSLRFLYLLLRAAFPGLIPELGAA